MRGRVFLIAIILASLGTVPPVQAAGPQGTVAGSGSVIGAFLGAPTRVHFAVSVRDGMGTLVFTRYHPAESAYLISMSISSVDISGQNASLAGTCTVVAGGNQTGPCSASFTDGGPNVVVANVVDSFAFRFGTLADFDADFAWGDVSVVPG